MDSIDLLSLTNIHPSWNEFYSPTIVTRLNEIANKIASNHTPCTSKILRFSSVDINKVKVVIVGQDPYPQPNIATGRAFEVNNLTSWLHPFPQASLKNIVRNLYRTYYGDLRTFSQIRGEIEAERFRILPPPRLFDHWEHEGVLLLNTYYSCEIGKPQSHRHIWGNFGEDVIKYIRTKNPQAIWFLWGNAAQSYASNLDESKTICTCHPSSRVNVIDYINNECFDITRRKLGIHWLNVDE